jgi:hypothetical protein
MISPARLKQIVRPPQIRCDTSQRPSARAAPIARGTTITTAAAVRLPQISFNHGGAVVVSHRERRDEDEQRPSRRDRSQRPTSATPALSEAAWGVAGRLSRVHHDWRTQIFTTQRQRAPLIHPCGFENRQDIIVEWRRRADIVDLPGAAVFNHVEHHGARFFAVFERCGDNLAIGRAAVFFA